MNSKNSYVRRFRFSLLVGVGYLMLAVTRPTLGLRAAALFADNLVEMMLIVPPIFVLVGVMDVWVPRSIVERNVGPGSGAKGWLISILAGSAAAGPLYAAFPVAATMLAKGCSVENAAVFLGAWACIKIPMLIMETRFLGPGFTLARLLLTVPSIILIGWLVGRLCPAPKAGDRAPAGR